MPVDSRLSLCQPEALPQRRVDPLDEVVTRFDRAGAIDQRPDHVGFRDPAAFRPTRETSRPLLVEFDCNRGHGNTAILPDQVTT